MWKSPNPRIEGPDIEEHRVTPHRFSSHHGVRGRNEQRYGRLNAMILSPHFMRIRRTLPIVLAVVIVAAALTLAVQLRKQAPPGVRASSTRCRRVSLRQPWLGKEDQ